MSRAFVSEFELDAWPDIYLEARHLGSGCPSAERATALVRAFWQDESGSKRTDTTFVYLNLEDQNGRFCFQLHWDRQSGRIETSDQQFY